MPRTGALHILKSQGPRGWGRPLARDRGNGPKARPAAYRWTSGAGWVLTAPTSYDAVKVKAVNREPMSRPGEALALQGGEEVSYVLRAHL